MRPHPKIRKAVKWGGVVGVVGLLYLWPLDGTVHVPGVRLAPRDSDVVLLALLAAIGVATTGAWVLDEIIIPAGTPIDPARLRDRVRRAARATVAICLILLAAQSAWFGWGAWRLAHDPFPQAAHFWTVSAYVATGLATSALASAWAVWHILRPRRARAPLCLRCGYDRTGLTPAAACPECNTPAPVPTPLSPASPAK